MARYYGTVQGNRGEATRLGHRSLYVTAQSYNGDVVVQFMPGPGEEDHVQIYVRPHGGNNDPRSQLLYHGSIAKLLDQSARKTMLHALATKELAEG